MWDSFLETTQSAGTTFGDGGDSLPFPGENDSPLPEIRLRRACDNCNSRKVKCDDSGPPCKPCASLDMPCTFQRPTRKKGPISKHIKASKRQKFTNTTSIKPSYPPAANLQSVATSPQESSIPAALLAESICDLPTLLILVDDYFTYIHPIIPLPHEPTFRASLARRDDRVDRGFIALLAAMLEILVASFPRRPLQIFASEQAKQRYHNAGALIDQCHRVFNEARGTGFNDREATLNDALCSYLAGLAAGYLFDMPRQRRYLSECVVILRTLGFHKSVTPSNISATSAHPAPGISPDYIYQQSGLRLFWLCFVGSMSVRQLGGYDADILMPPTSHSEKLPPLPAEVDDEFIYPSTILEQPPHVVSVMTGFNLNVRLFRSFHSLIALEMVFGADIVYHWKRQRQLIRQALAEVKSVTKDAPGALQHCFSDETNPSQTIPGQRTAEAGAARPYNANLTNNVSHFPGDQLLSSGQKDSKRAVQYEIQKANIYATQLATRSFLVEKFWNLYEIHERDNPSSTSMGSDRFIIATSPVAECVASGLESRYQGTAATPSDGQMDTGEQQMSVEREDIVRDMAMLLRTINQVNMEPNGLSFCNKIRQVASTLLNQERSYMSSMPTLDAQMVTEYLHEFCNILTKLERLGPGRIRDLNQDGNFSTTQDAEEEALIHWASLKEHQEKFVRSEGFLANANV